MEQFRNSFGYPPATIDYTVDVAAQRITFEVFVAGLRVGGGTLDRQNPSLMAGGSALGLKAEATLTADFETRQLRYAVTVCVPRCTTREGMLMTW